MTGPVLAAAVAASDAERRRRLGRHQRLARVAACRGCWAGAIAMLASGVQHLALWLRRPAPLPLPPIADALLAMAALVALIIGLAMAGAQLRVGDADCPVPSHRTLAVAAAAGWTGAAIGAAIACFWLNIAWFYIYHTFFCPCLR